MCPSISATHARACFDSCQWANRKNAELTQELERIKSEFEALQQHAGGAAASGEARHGDGGRGREGDIEKLIEYGFDPSLAERALQHESVFEAAVEWCLSSATAAKLDLQPQARAPNIANGCVCVCVRAPVPECMRQSISSP
jgi:hypothetical protein